MVLRPKIAFQANVCGEAGGVTEDVPSHMCREITVKAAGPVTQERVWVCLGGSMRSYGSKVSVCEWLKLFSSNDMQKEG